MSPSARVDFCWPAGGRSVGEVALLGYWSGYSVSHRLLLGFEARLSSSEPQVLLVGQAAPPGAYPEDPWGGFIACGFMLVTQEAFQNQ